MFGQRRNIKCDFTALKHNPFSFIYRDCFFRHIFEYTGKKNKFLGAGGSHSSDSPFRILH